YTTKPPYFNKHRIAIPCRSTIQRYFIFPSSRPPFSTTQVPSIHRRAAHLQSTSIRRPRSSSSTHASSHQLPTIPRPCQTHQLHHAQAGDTNEHLASSHAQIQMDLASDAHEQNPSRPNQASSPPFYAIFRSPITNPASITSTPKQLRPSHLHEPAASPIAIDQVASLGRLQQLRPPSAFCPSTSSPLVDNDPPRSSKPGDADHTPIT
ncbi:hypothetical protein ACLOJK_018499, partial [Asimina triloba]